MESERRKHWSLRIALSFVIACVLTYLPYHLFDGSGVRDLPRMHEELDSLRQQTQTLADDNARLEQTIQALREDPRAIEKVARGIGMVRPNEVIFSLPKNTSQYEGDTRGL